MIGLCGSVVLCVVHCKCKEMHDPVGVMLVLLPLYSGVEAQLMLDGDLVQVIWTAEVLY